MVLVSPSVALAVPLGIALGLGLWTLVALIPRLGAPRLGLRVAHYLVDVSASARDDVARRPPEPASALLALGAPWARSLRRVLARVLGGDAEVLRRLRLAGWSLTVDDFRSRQLLGAAVGAVAGTAVAAVAAHVTTASGLLLAGAIAIAVALGVIAPDQLLVRAGRARQRRVAAELPTVLEFLTLALAAGEGILDALRRVARAGNGELAREFARAVAEVNAGAPLPDALVRAADALGLPALTRTVDQLVAALERGTPLVGVLRAQAQDSRDEAKRELLESAGRKEVAMLVPLVFLILPVTILFAVFPGIVVLQVGF
jgi:tight adherence protein C